MTRTAIIAILTIFGILTACNEKDQIPEPVNPPADSRVAPESTPATAEITEPADSPATAAPERKEAPVAAPPGDEARDTASITSDAVGAGGLKLNSVTIAQGVKNREPVMPGTSFTIGDSDKVFAILDVQTPDDESPELTVSWQMPDSEKEIGRVKVEVPAGKKSWRTWSFTRNARRAGRWHAVVRNSNNELLTRVPFDMTPSGT